MDYEEFLINAVGTLFLLLGCTALALIWFAIFLMVIG